MNSPLPQIESGIPQTQPVVQFEDQSSSIQPAVVPNQQPVLPNFIINIQPSQTTSTQPSEPNATQIEQNKPPKKRGRKPKSVLEAEQAAAIRTDVCSIQYRCEKNHPNHHLDGNFDTYPIENIVEYDSNIPKNEVNLNCFIFNFIVFI